MSEIQKNNLMFLQNEILGDIKKVENKLDNKIQKISKNFDDNLVSYEKKINHLETLYNIIKQKTQNLNNDSNDKDINTKINSLNKKIEDYFTKIDSKLTLMQSNYSNACYKYEKAIMNNSEIPGLIGDRCPYSSLRNFYENMHKKINESLRNKEQLNIDLKKYKEKMDGVIIQNKTQLPMFESRITNYFDSQIKDINNKLKEQMDIFEERVNSLRIENGKYSSELVEKMKDLNNKFSNIDIIIKNSLEEISSYKNLFKSMDIKIKNFEEQYNTFQEKFNMINKLDENIKKIKNKDNILEDMINQIKSKYLIKKEEIDNYDDNKNKSFNNKNDIEYKLQNEEMEINSLINSKQANIKDDNSLNKKKLKEKNINVGQRKIKHKNNYLKKKENLFDESYEYTKINNIIFDSNFFKKSNFQFSSYSNDYYNQNYRIKRPKTLYNRVKSGKISKHLSFLTNDNNDEQINNDNMGNDYMIMSDQGYSIPYEFEINNNILSNEKIKEDDNIKNSNISINIYKSQNSVKNKYDLDSNESHCLSRNKYSYLDKKIDILSNVMIENLNKLIFQINYLKKNINQINCDKKGNAKNNLPSKLLFRSPTYSENSNFKKVFLEQKRKLSQKFKIVRKDNEIKTIFNRNANYINNPSKKIY